jgi:hypothetical protein
MIDQVFSKTIHQLLDIPPLDQQKQIRILCPALLMAIKHQNIIGWDLFMKGFTSIYWSHAYHDLHHNTATHASYNWKVTLVQNALALYKGIWEDRNKHIHGNNRVESNKLRRQKLHAQVCHIYRNPPRLAHRYQSIRKVPLQDCLNRRTPSCNIGSIE